MTLDIEVKKVVMFPDGRMDTNICIRTFEATNGEVSCWGGGGVVADSTADSEFEETFHKVAPFMRCLERAHLHS